MSGKAKRTGSNSVKAILDIGKTHIKLLFVKNGAEQASFSCKNAPIAGMYPQADVASIWAWLAETFRSYPHTASVIDLVFTTHGATAALINTDIADKANALALPVLDYEFTGVDACTAAYQQVRPDFEQTLSPELPAGLNLGKQLFWLQQTYPEKFNTATHIVMYPQYWAWRFGGELASEVTSLGCHTDMWVPKSADYSSLVSQQNWRHLMPTMRNAWDCLGQVSAGVAEETGLPVDCNIYAGVHDSNASFLRYLKSSQTGEGAFTVISTGTWTILMQGNGDVSALAGHQDTLANVDVKGNPVCCARFMGGREYESICSQLGGNISMTVEHSDVQQAIHEQWLVTPDFSAGNGPFGGMTPSLCCPEAPKAPQAIATLYCALMIDQRLNDLSATGPIFIEGAFLKNPILCQIVAQLRPEQPVYLSADNTGTVMGAAALIDFEQTDALSFPLNPCKASEFAQLSQYKAAWYNEINKNQS